MTRNLVLAAIVLLLLSICARAETEIVAVSPYADTERTIDLGRELSDIRSVQLLLRGETGNPVVVCMPDTIFQPGTYRLTVDVASGGGVTDLPWPMDVDPFGYMDYSVELTPDPSLGWSELEDGVFSYAALLERVAAPEGCFWWSLPGEWPMFACWLVIDHGSVDTERDSWDGLKARYR